MKIAYLCSDVDIAVDSDEGCSIHVRELARAFTECGHDVTIFCVKLNGTLGRLGELRVIRAAPCGVDAVTWPLLETEPGLADGQLFWNMWSTQANAWMVEAAVGFYKDDRPDLIYERHALFGCAGVELARRFDVPLVLEVNAPLRQEYQGPDSLALRETAERLDSYVFRNAGAVVAVSAWLRDWLVAEGAEPGRVHVIPNAVAGRLFAEQPSGAGVRARFGLDGKRVVGFLGSFKRWHDLEGLLRAFHALRRKDVQLRLLLVGSGAAQDGIGEMADRLGIADSIVFAGGVPHEEVPAHLAAMDVAVAPLRPSEQHLYFSPLKMFESMAAGTPTLAAAVGQAGDIIDHGRTGWLYPAGDAGKLGEGLAALLYTPGLAARIGEAARQQVLARHTWRAVAEEVLDLAAAPGGEPPALVNTMARTR